MIEGYYKEINIKSSQLDKELEAALSKIKYDDCDKSLYRAVNSEYALSRVSEESLREIMDNDRQVATEDCNVLKFNHINLNEINNIIALALKQYIKKFGVSGRIWYPENGFMGWHTNSNNRGHRLYCTYAKENEKSFFRYRDPDTENIVTSYDKKGWNFRVFKICEKPLWHSVYSATDRISLGYALYI